MIKLDKHTIIPTAVEDTEGAEQAKGGDAMQEDTTERPPGDVPPVPDPAPEPEPDEHK